MTLLNNILRRNAKRSDRVLRRNYLLHDAIEGQMIEVKGIGRRRRTQLLDDLGNRRIYWELKEAAKDKKDGNDSLSIEHKDEMQFISYKFKDLLISSMLNK